MFVLVLLTYRMPSLGLAPGFSISHLRPCKMMYDPPIHYNIWSQPLVIGNCDVNFSLFKGFV